MTDNEFASRLDAAARQARAAAPADTHQIVLRLDGLIRNESDLVSARINWLVISQSFLFSAFATASNAGGGTVHAAILLVTPVLGFVLSLLALRAVGAAHEVSRDLTAMRTRLTGLSPGDGPGADPGPGCEADYESLISFYLRTDRPNRTDWNGALPSKFIPPLFIVAWLVLLCVVLDERWRGAGPGQPGEPAARHAPTSRESASPGG